ncbi:MAG: hypothetical protein WA183_05325 [Chthoniobacterales bacterium]
MGSDLAGFEPCGKSSGRPPATKIGQLAYWSAVALIFGWAAWLRFRLPLDPIALSNYLLPALSKLSGAEFGQIHLGRTIIYPGFLYLLVRVFGDFRAITITQNLLGLLAGGMLLLTWRRIRDFIPSARLPHPIYHCLGLLAVAIYMFSREPLLFERDTRPEGICGFLISINLYVVIEFTACCFLERRRTATVTYGIAAVFSSILLASVKPSFWLTAIVALLPVAMFFFRRRWFWQKIALVGGTTVGAALLSLPQHSLIRNDDIEECFLPTQLFVIHANLIRDQMADDLECGAKVPYPLEWLGHVHTTLSAEIAKSSAAWRRYYGQSTLGFDPDFLMYNESSIVRQLDKEFGNNVSALCAFYRFYYWRIWRQRPLLVVKKIARQMAIFYAPKCPAYRLRKSVSLTDEYNRSVTSLEPDRKIWTAYPPAMDFMSRTALLAQSAPVVQQSAYIRRPHQILAETYLPLLLIALALSAVVFMQEERRRRFGWLAALILFVYSYTLASCLEVAIVHSLENPRYSTAQMFVTILAQFLTILLILEILLGSRALIGRRRISAEHSSIQ